MQMKFINENNFVTSNKFCHRVSVYYGVLDLEFNNKNNNSELSQ